MTATRRAPGGLSLVTDLRFWRGETLFDEHLGQWIERAADDFPITAAFVGPHALPDARDPAIRILGVTGRRALTALPAAARRRPLLLAISTPNPEGRPAAIAAASLAKTRFAFRPRPPAPQDGYGPGVLDMGAGDGFWPLAPLRRLPRRWLRAHADEAPVLAVVRTAGDPWAEFTFEALSRLAAGRGRQVRRVDCGPDPACDPQFLDSLLKDSFSRIAVIGDCIEVTPYLRRLAELLGSPYVELSLDGVFPSDRTSSGSWTLMQSIARFLQTRPTARRAGSALDDGWPALRTALGHAVKEAGAAAAARSARAPPRAGGAAARADSPARQEPWSSLRMSLDRLGAEADATDAARADWRTHVRDAVRTFCGDGAQDPQRLRKALDLVKRLCAEPPARRLWRMELTLVGRFLDDLPLSDARRKAALDQYLVQATWRSVWGSGLPEPGQPARGPPVRAERPGSLPQSRSSIGSVFVHSHTPFNELFWRWLDETGQDAGVLIGRARLLAPSRADAQPAAVMMQFAQELKMARDALQSGRHVHIAADGYFGRRGVEVPFLGRQRPFQPAFARLALQAQSPVHPVSTLLDSSGEVLVRIGPAFETATGTGVEDLVAQYARHLARAWLAGPADVQFSQMFRHLVLPRAPGRAAARRRGRESQFVVCLGLYGSGSTWMFNLVREIWRDETGGDPSLMRSSYLEEETGTLGDLLTAERVVIKAHGPSDRPSDALFRVIGICRGPVIVTVREPLDAIASLIRRFGMSFPEALERVAHSATTILQMTAARECMLFRYEDGFVGDSGTFDTIAGALGIEPRDGLKDWVLGRLTADAVRERIDGLESTGAINDGRPVDPSSHWHRGHVGDGLIGKHLEVLSPMQQDLARWRTAAFRARFGYSNEKSTAPSARLVIVTDVAYWRSDRLIGESLRQWIEGLVRTMPVLVVFRATGGVDREPGLRSAEQIRVVGDGVELESVISGCIALSTVVAFADSAQDPACASAGELGAAIRLEFDGAQMRGPCLRWPDGAELVFEPFRYSPAAALASDGSIDRARVHAILGEPASEWDEMALACVRRIARRRGVEVVETACPPGALSDPEFYHSLIGRPPSPTVLIGASRTAWAYCRCLLGLGEVPHLLLSELCILPEARVGPGRPSLVRSIERLLDGEAEAEVDGASSQESLRRIAIALAPG